MPLLSASAIHPPYRRRDIGMPEWTRIGFPSGSPASSRQSSRPPPAATVLVCTPLDIGSPPSRPLGGSGWEPDVAGAEDAADHDRAIMGCRHPIARTVFPRLRAL